jgi:hypothetical protein
MYNKKGEITINREEMFGRPTKYKVTKSEYLLFVNKTDCNTNMKEDAFVGGQLFVLPVDMASQSNRNCAVTNIHLLFYVLHQLQVNLFYVQSYLNPRKK